MTFKNIQFDDSPTMRSLARLAEKKGWIKHDPIEKTASIKEDLSSTINLTLNILKLCSGLRNSGMDKFADELEKKFLAYKQANTLYNTQNEDGDDLINSAHPKGGHQIADVAGDAFVETVIEKHLKILDVINKKPTGKLASNKEIMGAVLQVLGQAKPINNIDYVANKILELNKSQSSSVDKKLAFDKAWTDGVRANGKYINEIMMRAAYPINNVITLLDQLLQLASSDGRINSEVSTAISSAQQYLISFNKDYLSACKSAFEKARSLEKSRLSNVDDLEQSRVSFDEVGSVFNFGLLSKTNIGKQKTFNGVVSALQLMEKGLGNLIFDKFSPGFDFDEPYMKNVRDKAFGLFSQIKRELGSV